MRIKYVGINDFKKCESSNNKKKMTEHLSLPKIPV